MDPGELEQKWVDAAMKAAAINPKHWRPGRGVDQNRQTIQAVYGYYGERFVAHHFLLWADMANVIGATFYAAFMDLAILPDAARQFVKSLGRAWRHLRRDAAGELGFYETLFLTMQKKIFEDQASMHEAYLDCGLPEIERFYEAGIIDLTTREAWEQIDLGRNNGDQDALDNGCRMLLWREQRDIIDRFYVTMFNHHGPEGWAFTYAMTLAGTPSVPGARSMAEVFPVVFPPQWVPAPIRITTPLPDGNVAHFADRWRLIEADTLPAYLKYVRGDLNEALKSALVPVAREPRSIASRSRPARLCGGCSPGGEYVVVRSEPPTPPGVGAPRGPARTGRARSAHQVLRAERWGSRRRGETSSGPPRGGARSRLRWIYPGGASTRPTRRWWPPRAFPRRGQRTTSA